MRQRLHLYVRLTRLDKPIGILLLLWPTLWALWIAGNGRPDMRITCIFILGTVLMRSAGCVINDYADRHFDKHVQRTRQRPLTAGLLGTQEALLLAAALALLSFLLVLQLNALTIALSFAALFLAVSYPFTKRFFSLPQAYLGIAFGFGIPMAFAALNGEVPGLAWALLLANVCWSLAYDTEYAMVDRNDDVRIGIRSSALFFGQYDVAAVMFCYLTMLELLVWVGMQAGLRWPYYVGLCAAALMVLYHYTLIRGRQREGCFRAFMHNNWLGGAVFAGLAASYWLAG